MKMGFLDILLLLIVIVQLLDQETGMLQLNINLIKLQANGYKNIFFHLIIFRVKVGMASPLI